jgi:cellulose synthase/poly-beta-1,6-N-acetylglucosamine synthase-like glycosyltransferase
MHSTTAAEAPRVGVVIIGRNEAAHLRGCIASVRAMHFPQDRVETVYVDSDSIDGSAELAEAEGIRVIRLSGSPMTAARGRNAGWRALDASFILFLDGDVAVDPDFVARSLSHFEEPRLVSVWGVLREMHPEASIYNRICDLDWIFPLGEAEFFGGIALVRRAGLLEVDGFNEELCAGEEPELSCRLRGRGWSILHTDVPMALHDLAMTRWSQYWTRLVRGGLAYAQVAEMYAGTPNPMWTAVSRDNLRRGSFWLALAPVMIGCALALGSAWPALFGMSLGAVMVLRTAWKSQHRSRSWTTLLLFGMHAHFQQVPILLGQWRYWRSRRARTATPQRQTHAQTHAQKRGPTHVQTPAQTHAMSGREVALERPQP